jgi:hypothetical protein
MEPQRKGSIGARALKRNSRLAFKEEVVCGCSVNARVGFFFVTFMLGVAAKNDRGRLRKFTFFLPDLVCLLLQLRREGKPKTRLQRFKLRKCCDEES